jgi:hypothetical protein
MKLPIPAFKPMPEEEEDALMKQVGDIIENGGRMPQEITNELLWAQGMKAISLIRGTRTQVRKNATAISILALGFGIIAVVIGLTHGEDVIALLGVMP